MLSTLKTSTQSQSPFSCPHLHGKNPNTARMPRIKSLREPKDDSSRNQVRVAWLNQCLTSSMDEATISSYLDRCDQFSTSCPEFFRPVISDELEKCRTVKQPFPYSDLWDLAMSAPEKTELKAGLPKVAETLLVKTLDIVNAKLDLEQSTKKPVTLVVQEGSVKTPIESALLKVDYGTVGQLFSHLPVFYDVQAPGKAIPGADTLSFSDSTLNKLHQFAQKIKVEL